MRAKDRNGNWLQIVCSLRHEAGQPRNLCGIPLLELGLDVHLTIVHPLHHLLGRGTHEIFPSAGALGDWVRVWR